ncbi:MAG TPA: DCC1-like thiol-disulfide oxidoreductase family protein [Fimbriimonas sp.]|nr:DCC1-like thiol-disulfide oxidoreductase family protein [Fimbriimonas sp.]
MEERLRELAADGPIVFYDGDCGLCDRFVRLLIKIDKKRVLRFATLQGETAKEALGELQGEPETWSVQLLDEKGTHLRSTAALRALAAAGGVWKLSLALLVVPKFIRDGVYRWVATNRRKFFGGGNSCMIPTPALRERFLP